MIKIKNQLIEVKSSDKSWKFSLENSDASIIRRGQEVKPSLDKAKKGMFIVK